MTICRPVIAFSPGLSKKPVSLATSSDVKKRPISGRRGGIAARAGSRRNGVSVASGTTTLTVMILGFGALAVPPVDLLARGIGISLGYAVNPAYDLPLRLMHVVLPIPGKRDSD